MQYARSLNIDNSSNVIGMHASSKHLLWNVHSEKKTPEVSEMCILTYLLHFISFRSPPILVLQVFKLVNYVHACHFCFVT